MGPMFQFAAQVDSALSIYRGCEGLAILDCLEIQKLPNALELELEELRAFR
jgi:hypothetical protein